MAVQNGSEGADSASKLPTPNDCVDSTAPIRERDGDMCEEIAAHSVLLNNDSTSDEQGGLQGAPSTAAVSVSGAHAG